MEVVVSVDIDHYLLYNFYCLNTIVFSGAGFYSPKSVRNTDRSILNNTRQRAPWTMGMRR